METLTILVQKFKPLANILNERQLRIWSATEARAFGHGGIKALASVTGLSEKTISRGLAEISSPGRKSNAIAELGTTGSRISGGGRKTLLEKYPDLSEKLESLISPTTRGNPESSLRWTIKSLSNLANELKNLGYSVSRSTVSLLLEQAGYSLQGNSKVLEGTDHEDRDAQFNFINDEAKRLQDQNNPVVSVDTKKKEIIGNFANNGAEWEPAGCPVKTNTHDFEDKELGKVAPYGVYDVFKNEGWVSVGISSDTAEFAVNSIRTWWHEMGKEQYANATEIMITADCGGSNSYRNRLWKTQLQNFSNEIAKTISVRHYPPGTSKWNKIEHRMFSHISQNWRGRPLITRETVVNLIGNTSTSKGLFIKSKIDLATYEKGIKIKDNVLNNVNMAKNEFHGEWNYSISPNNS
jgi:hypothetical protein